MADPGLPDLTGRVALVTGAGGVVGGGIARRFAAAGADVAVHFRTSGDAARALVEEITAGGGRALALAADLTDEVACHDLVASAHAWRGRLDAVVNNAGVQPVQPLAGMTAADWRAVADANTVSAFCCTQAAAELMADQDGGGSVTQIASIEGTQPAAGHAHYSASKAALIMLARAAALEYGPRGIRVNAVSPGLIDHPSLAAAWPEGVARWHAACPLPRLATPSDIGNACVFLASPAASFITGHNLTVDGGISTHPTW